MFHRGVVHIVVAAYIVDLNFLMFDRGVVHIVVAGYIVNHYGLRFDRNNMNHSFVKHETVMDSNITATTI